MKDDARDYQQRGFDCVLSELENVRSTCVIWATGLGKTHLATMLIEHFLPRQTLFLCERKGLVEQTAAKIEEQLGIKPRIEQGNNRVDPELLWKDNTPVVATIQSLNGSWGGAGKRMYKFKPKLVICDEFHHCFKAGTIVGGKPIETIKPGDLVDCADIGLNRITKCRVLGLYSREAASTMTATFESGTRLECTPDHPVWDVESEQYVCASAMNGRRAMKLASINVCTDLKPFSVQFGVSDRVVKVEAFGPATVYDIEVEGCHNYFANGILVHNSTAPSYGHFFSYLPPECKLVGLTATPQRLDGKALGKHFETTAHQLELPEAIDLGWLCPVAPQYVGIEGLDYSKLRTVRGDFDQTQLKAMMEAEQMVQRMAVPTLEAMFGVPPRSLNQIPQNQWKVWLDGNATHPPFRTIAFCVSVAHAELMCDIMNRVYPGLFQWICGKTLDDDRRVIMADFSSGKRAGIANCGVLGEGVDVPDTTLIAMLRPTKSLSLYTQQLGRATRTLRGTLDGMQTADERKLAIARSAKPFCRILDGVGNTGRHHVISSIDVLGGDLSEEVKKRALSDAVAKGTPVNIEVTLENADKKLKAEAAEVAKRNEERRKQFLVAGVSYQLEDRRLTGGRDNGWVNGPGRNGSPPTQPQSAVMGRAGVHPSWWTRNNAKWIIGQVLVPNGWRVPSSHQFLLKPKEQHAKR
jgi:superfamily II DNA or RNA helicase